MSTLDLTIFYALWGLSFRSVLLNQTIIFCAEYLIYAALLVVMYLMYRAWSRGSFLTLYFYGVAVLAGLIARFGLAELVRAIYARPRPYVALHLPHLISDTAYSFPSGHTIFLFALATVVFRISKKTAWLLYGVGLVVGLSRVAAGVHYPSDILGGAFLGVLVGYAACWAWARVQQFINLPLGKGELSL